MMQIGIPEVRGAPSVCAAAISKWNKLNLSLDLGPEEKIEPAKRKLCQQLEKGEG